MKNYHRTTITIPKEVYQKTKIRAASQEKSLSRFIVDLLEGKAPFQKQQPQKLPFGKYAVTGTKSVQRTKIYDTYLKRKISR